MARRRGRRRKQPPADLNETRGYFKLKEEAIDRKLCRTLVEEPPPVVVRHYGMSDLCTCMKFVYIYIYIYTVIPRLTSDPASEFFG